MNTEEIHNEARKKFLEFKKNPPATDEMYDFTDFVMQVAYDHGWKDRGESIRNQIDRG